MDDDELCPVCDGHLEAEFEDRTSGGIAPFDEEGRETDPELAEWLAARAAEIEERRWALADREEGEGRRA